MINDETIEQKAIKLISKYSPWLKENLLIEEHLYEFDDVAGLIELAIAEEREANNNFPLEPTDEMRESGAKRLVSVESDTDWLDKFTALQRSAARNEAERVWRSMWLASPKNEVNQ